MNTPRVFVVQFDARKDFSQAEQFGTLVYVFTDRIRNNYAHAVQMAMKVLEDFHPQDYLLPIGEPLANCICMESVMSVLDEPVVNMLRYNSMHDYYEDVKLDFNSGE